eukprot:1824988-Pyramimonas_sp.AAC.1
MARSARPFGLILSTSGASKAASAAACSFSFLPGMSIESLLPHCTAQSLLFKRSSEMPRSECK